jgi:FkbM family methyltransferase
MRLIDIGANVGDTMAFVRGLSQCPILCVEAHEYYYSILLENIKRAKFQSVEAACVFVGTFNGELKGQLVSTAGTARFISSDATSLNVVGLSSLLLEYPLFETSKMLKIDTDGYDCCILQSELNWLSERKPVIFFEYDPYFFNDKSCDGARIFEDLVGGGYAYAIIYDNIGDYLTAVDLQKDKQILKDLQNYYIGRGGRQYIDVAVFHNEDRDIAEIIRTKEATWSLCQREVRLGKAGKI